ncbi:hypothetical protein KIW84_011625 [Lathyrus oleraceus]|uniref:Protein FAR1-RELATED SEQUENCE n=1 Tax=Pisum sativum TaxID=3888 RepID=A0A9D5BFI5_PEA|nr:hypothetical protein KIW84_011625 [Pisum sativum]
MFLKISSLVLLFKIFSCNKNLQLVNLSPKTFETSEALAVNISPCQQQKHKGTISKALLVLSKTPTSANKEISEYSSVSFQSPAESIVVEKICTTDFCSKKPQLSSNAYPEVPETEDKADVNLLESAEIIIQASDQIENGIFGVELSCSIGTGTPMESHAATVLTLFAFSKLQEQLVLAAHYASFSVEDGFLARHHTKVEGGRKVYWSAQEGVISCSCHQFEFSGILCRHSLRVLSTGNCFQIPDTYLPIRWRRISMPSSRFLQNASAVVTQNSG